MNQRKVFRQHSYTRFLFRFSNNRRPGSFSPIYVARYDIIMPVTIARVSATLKPDLSFFL